MSAIATSGGGMVPVDDRRLSCACERLIVDRDVGSHTEIIKSNNTLRKGPRIWAPEVMALMESVGQL